MNERCPDCGKTSNSRCTRCCDECWKKRREDIARRQALPVGGTSCSEEREEREIGGGGHQCFRGIPALRDDVRWMRGKHGNG